MALIPVYHQFASNFDVNPETNWTGLAGSWVRLVENGGKT